MTKEGIVVVLFFPGFLVFTVCESFWLVRSKGVDSRRAVALAALSNTIAITVGFFGSFVIFAVVLAMAWDSSLRNLTGGDISIWVATSVAVLFPFVLSVVAKLLLVKPFKLDSIESPFGYAFLSSLLFFLVSLAPPSLYMYFFMR